MAPCPGQKVNEMMCSGTDGDLEEIWWAPHIFRVLGDFVLIMLELMKLNTNDSLSRRK